KPAGGPEEKASITRLSGQMLEAESKALGLKLTMQRDAAASDRLAMVEKRSVETESQLNALSDAKSAGGARDQQRRRALAGAPAAPTAAAAPGFIANAASVERKNANLETIKWAADSDDPPEGPLVPALPSQVSAVKPSAAASHFAFDPARKLMAIGCAKESKV